jgi:hypothetical protein
MARAGQIVDNPITGERITFLHASSAAAILLAEAR